MNAFLVDLYQKLTLISGVEVLTSEQGQTYYIIEHLLSIPIPPKCCMKHREIWGILILIADSCSPGVLMLDIRI
jgi:hypothetical protein